MTTGRINQVARPHRQASTSFRMKRPLDPLSLFPIGQYFVGMRCPSTFILCSLPHPRPIATHEVALMPLAYAASYTRQRHERFIIVVNMPIGHARQDHLLAMQLPV